MWMYNQKNGKTQLEMLKMTNLHAHICPNNGKAHPEILYNAENHQLIFGCMLKKWKTRPEMLKITNSHVHVYLRNEKTRLETLKITNLHVHAYPKNAKTSAGNRQKKPPQVQICNISGRMQKKPPRCKYVMYPARPTLLLYTWDLPYIQPEAKKPPGADM